jgi:hypothetical protein
MTTRSRLLVASAIASLTLMVAAVPSGAGQSSGIDSTVSCNAATGEYDIEFTVFNNINEAADIFVGAFEVDGAPELLDFVPDPVPGNGGTSAASVSVPGTTTSYFLQIDLIYLQFTDELSIEATLDGDCEADPTTTTTSTTVAPTTTVAPAPAAVAVAARPAFTG